MNGITVLETIESRGVESDKALLLWLGFAVITIFACLIAVKIAHKIHCDDGLAILVAGAIVIGSFIITIIADCNGANIFSYPYQAYRCTIDDTVSFNDLTENYKILEKDGDVYVLKPIQK